VGMRQSGNRPRLALEARPPIGISGEVIGKDFDRDRAMEAGVAGLVNFAHAPGANETEDLVGPSRVPAAIDMGRYARPEDTPDQARRPDSLHLVLPRSRLRPRASTEGSCTRKLNKTGVRPWT